MSTYLVDVNDSDYQDFLTVAELLHTGGILSKTFNINNTQVLVKVNHSKKLEHTCIIKCYDQTNHEDIFKFFYTRDWQINEEN